MNSKYNYLTVNKRTGLDRSQNVSVPFAELANAPVDEQNIFDSHTANVEVKDMFLPNYSIRISKGIFAQDVVFVNTSAGGLDLLGSCLFPKGKFTSYTRQGGKAVEALDGTQNFKYDPQNELVHRMPANTPFYLIHIAAHPDYIFKILPEGERWADDLKDKISRNERVYGSYAPTITLAQERALQLITDCPLNGKLGEVMIETALTQILLIQMHEVFRATPHSNPKLSKRDTEIIFAVKEYITANFLDDHSLDSIAKNFALNTNKLMSLFRKAFGQSIFEYLGDLRMEHARKLLENDSQVVEVARTIGYKNAHHFSTAFKRRFGLCPSQI